MSYVKPGQLEQHRHYWAQLAEQHGWYREPFFVQVWVDADGNVTDSVSTIALDRDVVVLDVDDDDGPDRPDLSDLSVGELLERRNDWVLDAGELEAVNAELEAVTLEDALFDLQSYSEVVDPADRERLELDLDRIRRLVGLAVDVLESELEIRAGNAAGDWPSLVLELAELFGRGAEFEDELEDEDVDLTAGAPPMADDDDPAWSVGDPVTATVPDEEV